MVRSAGGSSGAQRDDLAAAHRHRGLQHLRRGDDAPAADDQVDVICGHF
jgi:hypothetical protein